MRIGIDVGALTEKKAGIGTYVNEIIKNLNDIDKKNEYYLYSNKDIYIDFKLNDNFKLCVYPCKIGTYFISHKIYKILKKDNIDVFWGTKHCLPRQKKNIKYILTIHDLALLKMPKVGELKNVIIQNLILKKSCKNADKIIAISESTKRDLIELLNINKEKIRVIYPDGKRANDCNLDENKEKQIESKYNIIRNNFLFFLSTIEPRKNIITLVKAFEILKGKNKDLKLIISGGLGWKYKKILKIINDSKYKEDIILTGYITEYEKKYFFDNAICFVYPSLYEGFGLPILEAMSAKQIVVTSNISSLPEVGGNAAYYYNNVLDYKELSNVIEKVINLPKKQREEQISIGIKQVSRFSWKKCADELLEEMNRM